jgi:hypothetical protein
VGEALAPGDVLPLCHDLLRRCAALQLASGQKTFDKLIPIYYGDETGCFDESKCGVILVQDRNMDAPTRPDQLLKESFTKISPVGKSSEKKWAKSTSLRGGGDFITDKLEYPVLLLFFDLGVDKTTSPNAPRFQVSLSQKVKPHVWAIHSRGHDRTIFGCVGEMKCDRECAGFFAATTTEAISQHDILATRNMTFYRAARDFRYSGFGQEHETSIQGSKVGVEGQDVAMGDAE